MQKYARIAGVVFVLALFVYGCVRVMNIGSYGTISPQLLATAGLPLRSDGTPYEIPSFANTYKNDKYHFSLSVPQGFSTQEIPNDSTQGQTIVLQDEEGNGIQILITPSPEDIAHLTADRVHQDIPDMKVSDVQPVEVGANHSGIAFMSDNEAFAGASREVWFVFHGNLYQISTYARLDGLLQTMFGTWKFE